MKLIQQNIRNIIELCKKYKVKIMYVFGSILTDRFNSESDIDLLFRFDDDVTYQTYADHYFGLYYGLKSLFGREIDLVDESSIKNRYFKEEVEDTRQLIYG